MWKRYPNYLWGTCLACVIKSYVLSLSKTWGSSTNKSLQDEHKRVIYFTQSQLLFVMLTTLRMFPPVWLAIPQKRSGKTPELGPRCVKSVQYSHGCACFLGTPFITAPTCSQTASFWDAWNCDRELGTCFSSFFFFPELSTVGDGSGRKMPRLMWLTVETECVILELIKALRPISCKCLHLCN